jgi:hypothetical protein
MATNVFFAAAPVKDFDAACLWYARLFGRGPDMRPNDIEAAWMLSDAAWMYVILDQERAGKAMLTQIIDGLDALVATLRERGIEAFEIEDIPDKYRKVSYRDPEGNVFAFGQVAG